MLLYEVPAHISLPELSNLHHTIPFFQGRFQTQRLSLVLYMIVCTSSLSLPSSISGNFDFPQDSIHLNAAGYQLLWNYPPLQEAMQCTAEPISGAMKLLITWPLAMMVAWMRLWYQNLGPPDVRTHQIHPGSCWRQAFPPGETWHFFYPKPAPRTDGSKCLDGQLHLKE